MRLAALTALLGLLVAACSSNHGGLSWPGGPAVSSPNDAQTVGLLADLRAAHVPDSGDEGKLIHRAYNVCQQSRSDPNHPAVLVRYTRQEFGSDAQAVTPAQAARVIDAVRRSFCP